MKTKHRDLRHILPAFREWISGRAIAVTILALYLSCCFAAAQTSNSVAADSSVAAELKTFAMEKEKQAQALASLTNDVLPSEFGPFFSAIQNDNWGGRDQRIY